MAGKKIKSIQSTPSEKSTFTSRPRGFFIVWNINHGIPRRRYGDFETAAIEARRLSDKHKGDKFGVFKVIECYQTLNAPYRVITKKYN